MFQEAEHPMAAADTAADRARVLQDGELYFFRSSYSEPESYEMKKTLQ